MNVLSAVEPVSALVAVAAPLVAVPLTLITFYLRSMREHQVSAQAQAERRIEAVESTATELRKAVSDMERDYTTKEEWLRECMHTRRVLEQLTETTVRIETTLQAMSRRGTLAKSIRRH